MQICTRLQWRNAKDKSDSAGSKGLTPCIGLCYLAVRLREALKDTHGALKGTKQSGLLLLKVAPQD